MRTLARVLSMLTVAVTLAAGGLTPAAAAEPTVDPSGYWTAERLRAATPELQADPGRSPGAESAADTARPATRGSTAAANSTVGRLFFRTPSGDASCTASVVNSATKNLIITAGHCVHPGGAGKAYHQNFLFAPGWNGGPSALGYWSGTAARASAEWAQSKKWDHDYAFVRLAPSNGTQIVDRVGGNAVLAGSTHAVADAQIWGYPMQAPYTGKTAQRCDATTTRINSYAHDAVARCDFNDGASGGPWLKDVNASGAGSVWAVTSRCAGSEVTGGCAGTVLYATPLPQAVYTLRDAVAGS